MTVARDRLFWKVGVEMELLAPAGKTRRDLAEAIAGSLGGRVRRIFHPQSEVIHHKDIPVFENLTLGYAVETPGGALAATCVDDLTLVDDLDAAAEASAGWYRILSDDRRLLGLVERHCDPEADQFDVLAPLADIFGVDLEILTEAAVARVCDRRGVSVAMAAPLPGQRNRPCELVTAPLTHDRDEVIHRLLDLAAGLSFSVPVEAATHVHFDGAALEEPAVLAGVIQLFGHYRDDLRRLVGTNPRCRRLGDWPKTVYRVVAQVDFASLAWSEAVARLREAEPVKYCDFNFINLLADGTEKRTFEVRIMPGSMDADFILRSVRLFEAMLRKCVDRQYAHGHRFPPFADFLAGLELDAPDRDDWLRHREIRERRPGFAFFRG